MPYRFTSSDHRDPIAGTPYHNHVPDRLGDQLHIADRTVEAHVTQILMKLGVDTSPDSHRRVLTVPTFLRHS